jgi:hypothetical protein
VTNITFYKEKKNRPDLTRVKMSKLVTLILRPIYSHKKQIKIDYETQFLTDPMLNDKIEKKSIK